MTRHESRTAVVRTYQVEHEAELARAVLEANGVQAVVLRDNAGGMLPMLHILFQARLVVAAEDLELARGILDGSMDSVNDLGGEDIEFDDDEPADEDELDDDENDDRSRRGYRG